MDITAISGFFYVMLSLVINHAVVMLRGYPVKQLAMLGNLFGCELFSKSGIVVARMSMNE